MMLKKLEFEKEQGSAVNAMNAKHILAFFRCSGGVGLLNVLPCFPAQIPDPSSSSHSVPITVSM